MAFSFIMPDIGEGVVEGEIVRWHVKPGDTVKEDQTLVEIMTDKATVQIPSPKAGKVAKLYYKEGDVAKVGKALLDIDAAGDAPAPQAEKPAPAAGRSAPVETRTSTPPPQQTEAANETPAPQQNVQALVASNGAREVLATPAVRKLARDEGVDINKVPGTGPYGRITREDVLRAASSGGQVISFTPPPQAQQKPQEQREAKVANVQESRWDREQPRRDDQPAVQQQRPQQQQPQQQRRDEQPRREEQQPRREDRPQQQPQQQQPQQQQPQVAAQLRSGAETRQPIRGLRKRIYDKMHQSKTTAAHFTYVEEFDLTELVKLREHINSKGGEKITFLPFIMKAVVAALKKFPTMNAHVDDQKQELVLRGDYNLGIAVQTDDGLMVPVVKNVDQKSIAALGREVASLSDKARKRQASSAELSGSTFTITSLGQIGGLLATPVINYPEVAIMGVHAIKKKPWVHNDRIEIRDIAHFSGSFDHRIIDGYVGAQFITEVKRLLEDPQTLFMEL